MNEQTSEKFLKPPPKLAYFLIAINLIFLLTVVPSYIVISTGNTASLPLLLALGIMTPLWIRLFRLGQIFAYIYYKYFWWALAIQFTIMSIAIIALSWALMTGVITLPEAQCNSNFKPQTWAELVRQAECLDKKWQQILNH